MWHSAAHGICGFFPRHLGWMLSSSESLMLDLGFLKNSLLYNVVCFWRIMRKLQWMCSGCKNRIGCLISEMWIQWSVSCHLSFCSQYSVWSFPIRSKTNLTCMFSVNQISGLKLMPRFLLFVYGESHLHLLIIHLGILH